MKFIGSRLGHHINHSPRVQPILRRKAAGLHAELLNRVRKREWKIDIGERVHMLAAVQQVIRSISLSAGNRNAVRAEIVFAAGQITHAIRWADVIRATRQHHQLRGQAAIQRQVDHVPLVDYLRNGGCLCLHHGGIRRHRDFLLDLSNSQRDV